MQILIKLLNETRIEIEIESTDNIISLKLKIQEKTDLQPDEQELVYRYGILDDDYKTIDEYQICENSEISVVARLRSGINISCKTMDGKTVAFEIKKTDKIIFIKNKIQHETGLLRDNQKLIYQDKLLEDDKTIDEYQICNQSVINVVAKIKIFVRSFGGRMITAELYETDKIRDLKCKIQEELKLNFSRQIMIFQDEILNEDDKTIYEYQIFDNCTIYLGNNEIEIFIKMVNDRNAIIKAALSDKIVDIKRKIENETKFHRDEQILIYENEILDDDKTIDEYQITDKSTISLKDGIQIFAKTMNGKTVTLEIKKSDKIIDVKYKFQEKTGLHPYEQILIYQGGILQNNKRIDEYQLLDKSVIYVVVRLRSVQIQIYVETINGKKFTLDVEKSQKLIDIKKKIQQKIRGFPDLKLMFESEMLDDDDKIIDEYQICDKSQINAIY